MSFLEVRLGTLSLMYDALVPLGALAAAPAYFLRSVRHPEYRRHLGERISGPPASLLDRLASLPRRPAWVQAVSVGEVLLAGSLMKGLSTPFVLSSTTPAGRRMAAELRLENLKGVFHFPIDWSPIMRRALEKLEPSALVCVETEIWPGILRQCGRLRVPALVVNGRISARSCGRYRKLRRLLAEPLLAIRLACMQTQADAERAATIGIPSDRIVVTGNIKFDAAGPGAAPPVGADLETFAGSRPGPVIVAGSTSAGEEEQVLAAMAGDGLETAWLILAPRHPERFDDVARLLEQRRLPHVRRSRLPQSAPDARVLLLDTVGELAAVYSLADAAFVGGSLVPRGGQNLIEPAAHGVPVVFGPHTENFDAVARALIECGGGFRVDSAGGLTAVLASLLADPDRRRAAGRAARALVETHRGATQRTIHHVLPFVA